MIAKFIHLKAQKARAIQMLAVLTAFNITVSSYGVLYSMPPYQRINEELNDSLLIDRDGNRYSVKKMLDNNLWMTTNLKLNIPDSYCYGGVKENCEQYGRLYTWESAQKGCNSLGEGWGLPTDDEWQKLARSYGMPLDSADYRIGAFNALLNNGSAQFNALLGGGRETDGKYARLDAHGFYWTGTEINKSAAVFYNFGKGSRRLYRQDGGEKSEAFSVRCLKKPGTIK